MTDIGFPVTLTGEVPVVGAPAEIDATNAAGLRTALLEAARINRLMVVDLSRTRFCDSAGLHALLAGRKHVRDEDGEMLLVVNAGAVLRVLEITGVDRMIPHFATLDEALAHAASMIAEST